MSTADISYVLPKILAMTPDERRRLLHQLADSVRDTKAPRRVTPTELARWAKLLVHRSACYAEGSSSYGVVNSLRDDLRLILDFPEDGVPAAANTVAAACQEINDSGVFDRAELFSQMRKALYPQVASELALVLGSY